MVSAKARQEPLRALVGRRLRALREGRRLTRAETARRAGVNRVYYGAVEAGKRNITLDMLERLARVVGIPPALLVADPAEAERLQDVRRVRLAQLAGVLDEDACDAVLKVMERFASYGTRSGRGATPRAS